MTRRQSFTKVENITHQRTNLFISGLELQTYLVRPSLSRIILSNQNPSSDIHGVHDGSRNGAV